MNWLDELEARDPAYPDALVAVPEPVRARDVTIRKLHQPQCHRPGCGWTGALYASFADAGVERERHLSEHRGEGR